MRHTIRILTAFCLLLAAFGCASETTPPTATTGAEPAEPVEVPPLPPTSADLEAPLPDPLEDPAGFWTQRVDRMFLNTDKDGDGFVSREEFEGKPDAFFEIDVNEDEKLTKEELYEYVFEKWVRQPEPEEE